MSDERFDELSKAIATTVSRRQALKLVGAAAVGGALSLVGARQAKAVAPGRCRRVGVICRQDYECCDFYCNPATGRCACRPGQDYCRRTRRCISCPPNSTFNADTCECTCNEDTTACDGSCCTADETCCIGYYGGQCCPPGIQCCPGGYCDFYGYGC
jgi:hypothetical protein